MTNDVDTEGTKTRAACTYTQADGVTMELTGTGTWTHDRHYLNNAPTGTWITTFAGSFTWTKGTGETGTCDYNLTRTVNTAANERTLIGTSCGNDVNRVDDWR